MTQVPITQLPIQNLLELKKSLEGEIAKLQQTIQFTNEEVLRLTQARSQLKQLDTFEDGKEMLIPITESIYVTGKTVNSKRPIIDLGTGYFAETTVEKADGFYNRRIQRLNAQQELLRQSFKEKHSQYNMVISVTNQKIQQQQQQQH